MLFSFILCSGRERVGKTSQKVEIEVKANFTGFLSYCRKVYWFIMKPILMSKKAEKYIIITNCEIKNYETLTNM